jgi:hypothetical protein
MRPACRTRKTTQNRPTILPGLAAAALAACIGAPAAHGDFNIVVVKGATTGGLTAYELKAENFGANNAANTGLSPTDNNTGSTLLGWDLTITMNNHSQGLFIETNIDIDGDGANAGINIPYSPANDADLSGAANDDPTDYSGVQPSFGSTLATFEGLPNGANTKSTTPYSAIEAVYINGDTVSHVAQPVWHSYNRTAAASTAINPAFTTPNGIWALEVAFAPTSGGVLDNTALRPFANIVVPTNSLFSISGEIGGETGNPFVFPATTVEPFLQLSLTNEAPPNSIGIASVTMSGSSTLGYAPQSFFAELNPSVKGYLSVTGFDPANDVEIYGLDASAPSLSQLITDLQGVVNPGAIVEAPTGSAGAILASYGDNIEVVFPNGPSPAGSPAYFSYDFSNYPGNVRIHNITVIPEPTTLTLLAFTSLGLLRRRRRNSLPHHN